MKFDPSIFCTDDFSIGICHLGKLRSRLSYLKISFLRVIATFRCDFQKSKCYCGLEQKQKGTCNTQVTADLCPARSGGKNLRQGAARPSGLMRTAPEGAPLCLVNAPVLQKGMGKESRKNPGMLMFRTTFQSLACV